MYINGEIFPQEFTVFAVLGLLGILVSTKVHTDGGDEDEASDGKMTALEDDLSTALL